MSYFAARSLVRLVFSKCVIGKRRREKAYSKKRRLSSVKLEAMIVDGCFE